MENINDTQYSFSESIHSLYIKVDTEWVIMCHWNIIFIKDNDLDTRYPICKAFCITTVNLLNKRIKDIPEDLCSIRDWFDLYRRQNKVDILFLSYCKNKASFQNWIWRPLRYSPLFLRSEAYLGYEIQDAKPQVWIDRICNEYLQDLFAGIFPFGIKWYWPWIYRI